MKCINNKEDLFDASKIGYLYLYLAEGKSIIVDNGITNLELTMSERERGKIEYDYFISNKR